MTIVCVGDSLTYGYGVPRRDTWVKLTAQRTGIELVNAGINGDTTGGMLARLGYSAIGRHPDAVLLMGGFNDLVTGCPNFIPQSNLMGMVHETLGAGIDVMVGIPIPCLWGSIREDWAAFAGLNLRPDNTGAYREWLLFFCRTFGIPAVDFWPPFLELGQEEKAKAYLDGIHPSREGHRLMSDTLCSALKKAGWWKPPM